jgi:Lrp/AsnC family leucine-responsive transcriptional regulator
MQEYEAFARQLFIENPCVRRFHTSIVVSRVKSGMMIPLDSD